MTFPLGESGAISAIALGFFFGFALERGGLTDSRKLLGQFDFTDWTVLKVMFGAISFAALGLSLLDLFGVIEAGSIFVPAAYLGSAAIGGLLVGAGMGAGGYCPGTSMAAAATGKWDALLFLLGLIVGTLAFSFVFPLYDQIAKLGFLEESDSLSDALPLPAIAIAILLVIASVLVFHFGGKAERKHLARQNQKPSHGQKAIDPAIKNDAKSGGSQKKRS